MWQVKPCDRLVTHKPYLSALEMLHDNAPNVNHLYSPVHGRCEKEYNKKELK